MLQKTPILGFKMLQMNTDNMKKKLLLVSKLFLLFFNVLCFFNLGINRKNQVFDLINNNLSSPEGIASIILQDYRQTQVLLILNSIMIIVSFIDGAKKS